MPEFGSVPDATVSVHLSQSAAEHTASQWGAGYTAAMVWHAAHRMKTTPGLGAPVDAAPGQVTSRAVSDGTTSVSQGHAAATAAYPGDEEYLTTVYGRRYLKALYALASGAPSFVGVLS